MVLGRIIERKVTIVLKYYLWHVPSLNMGHKMTQLNEPSRSRTYFISDIDSERCQGDYFDKKKHGKSNILSQKIFWLSRIGYSRFIEAIGERAIATFPVKKS